MCLSFHRGTSRNPAQGYAKIFSLCERTIRSRAALRKEGQVELLGRRPTDLARVQGCRKVQQSVNRKECRVSSYIAPHHNKLQFQFQSDMNGRNEVSDIIHYWGVVLQHGSGSAGVNSPGINDL